MTFPSMMTSPRFGHRFQWILEAPKSATPQLETWTDTLLLSPAQSIQQNPDIEAHPSQGKGHFYQGYSFVKQDDPKKVGSILVIQTLDQFADTVRQTLAPLLDQLKQAIPGLKISAQEDREHHSRKTPEALFQDFPKIKQNVLTLGPTGPRQWVAIDGNKALSFQGERLQNGETIESRSQGLQHREAHHITDGGETHMWTSHYSATFTQTV